MPEPDPSEPLTLAEQLRLLVSQGVPEEEAKARLGRVFRLKEIIYRPNYAVSYENASINWDTGQVSVPRLSPPLTAPEFFAYFQERGPFPQWDNVAWDHPVSLLGAIRLWSPQFARRLDEVKWRSPDEILMLAQQRQPTRNADRTAETAPEATDDLTDSEIPSSLRDDVARLLREWEIWGDDDRLVNACELAGQLIIEKTMQGRPWILKCASPALSGGLGADYQRGGETWRDGLGPYDFDFPNSMLRRPGGDWLSAGILGGIEAEGERRRVTRLAREAQDAAEAAAWAAERAKPMRHRQYFPAGEIADALARKLGRLEVDAPERARVILDIADWSSRGEFDPSEDSELVTLISEPPYFVPLAPVRRGGILVNPEWLILRRQACRQYLLRSPLAGASQLLRDWFPEAAAASPPSASGEPMPADTGEPQPLRHLKIGQASADAGTPRPRVPHAEVEEWYERTYIPVRQTAGERPSEAEDWAAAKLKFRDKVRRDQIRDLRRALASDDWRTQGRRPSSRNSAE